MVRVDPAVLSDPGRLGEWLTALDQVSWGGIGRNPSGGTTRKSSGGIWATKPKL